MLNDRILGSALPLLFLTVAGSAAPASAQLLNNYTGAGMRLDVTIVGLMPGDVAQLEVGDLASFGDDLDIALRLNDGRVFVNPDSWRFGGYEDITDGIVATSMTQTQAGADQFLILSDGSDLYRLTWTAFATPSLDPLAAGLGGDLLVAGDVEPSNGFGHVAVVDQNGTRCRIVKVTSNGATLANSFVATTAQGSFHDVAFVNFSGDSNRLDQLALITDTGVEIVEHSGALAVIGGQTFSYSGSPASSHLGRLPAEGSGTARDYLLWHTVVSGSGEVVFVMNSGHMDVIYTNGLGLQDLHVADWLGADGNDSADLVLPHSTTPYVWMANNNAPTSLGQSVFEITGTYANSIDMSALGTPPVGSVPSGVAPLVGSGDMDGDGATDLVLLEAGNRLCMLPGEHPSVVSERVEGKIGRVEQTTDQFIVTLHTPDYEAVRAEYTVWHSEEIEGFLEGRPIYDGNILLPAGGGFSVPTQFQWTPPVGDLGVLHVQVVPFDALDNPLPVSGFQWSPEPDDGLNIIAASQDVFPWYDKNNVVYLNGTTFANASGEAESSNNDGPNGTTPGPKPPASPVRCVPSRTAHNGMLCCPGDPGCPPE